MLLRAVSNVVQAELDFSVKQFIQEMTRARLTESAIQPKDTKGIQRAASKFTSWDSVRNYKINLTSFPVAHDWKSPSDP